MRASRKPQNVRRISDRGLIGTTFWSSRLVGLCSGVIHDDSKGYKFLYLNEAVLYKLLTVDPTLRVLY